MIPKCIHYCWFGQGKKSGLMKKCIKSWKKKCKEYEIIEWNETNFDISKCPLYVKQAYEEKKWAYVSDYARLWIIYHYGGIYLDTDVEVIRSFDKFLDHNAFFGFSEFDEIGTGVGFGAEKNNKLIFDMMSDYDDITFFKEDGSIDTTPCPIRNLHCFTERGCILNNTYQEFDDFTIYPTEYFSPKSYNSVKVNKTKNTHSIHWFSASWMSKKRQNKHKRKIIIDYIVHIPNVILLKILGEEKYKKIKQNIHSEGV